MTSMLSFSIVNKGKAIQIDCDQQGIAVLLTALATLIGQRASHRHLLTPSNGGHELSEVSVGNRQRSAK
jgi:hypothetical protein